jgi:hypothetical protein
MDELGSKELDRTGIRHDVLTHEFYCCCHWDLIFHHNELPFAFLKPWGYHMAAKSQTRLA